MLEVPEDRIVIPENRIRRSFDERKLSELKDSILRNGLFHPPTVEKGPDRDGFETWTLRAGERRLRILREIIKSGGVLRMGDAEIARGCIPVVNFAELSPLQRLEIEVEETVVRADFTWQERVAGTEALHKLRKAQNPAHSVKDTADEILGKPTVGGSRQPVADALIVSRYLHIPKVAKAGSLKDALKEVKKITDAGQRATLAAAALSAPTPHTLIKGDTLAILPSLPAGAFDVILTDPPYGVDADSFGSMADTGHDYKDSLKRWEELMLVFPDETYRVAKERAHAYVFCDVRQFDRLSVLMLLAGWTVFPTPIIWSKSNGMLPFPDHGPRRTYECICYAWKGDRKTLMVRTDVIDISGVKKPKVGAQKPVSLYCDLLSRSANPGDTVLDCFGGSGTILVAANRQRLAATYIEDNEDAFNIAQLRKDEREIDDGAEEHDGLEDIAIG